jgi:hypothetical protein
MKHRRLWLLGAAVLAADACVTSPTSTPGALGNGAFGYVCPNGADNACDAVTGSTAPLPAAIAVGAGFSLTYQATAQGLLAGAPESVSSSILGESAGRFQFVRAGVGGVIVPGDHGVVDFADIVGADIATIRMFERLVDVACTQVGPATPDAGTEAGVDDGGAEAGADDGGSPDAGSPDAGSPDAGADDAGSSGTGGGGAGGAPPNLAATTITLGMASDVDFEPVDSSQTPLAGPLPLVVTSSDDTIVSVGPSPGGRAHGIELCGRVAGAATITVTIQGTTVVFPVVVSGAP